MKKLDLTLRILLILLSVTPVLGTLGIFPAPTRDMYKTDEAFSFIEILMNSGYVMWAMAASFALIVWLTITNRMAAAALILLPLVVNIVGFHAFLDGGLFTSGSIMAVLLGAINIYFLWRNKNRYAILLQKSN